MNKTPFLETATGLFYNEALNTLKKYIAIPNGSPSSPDYHSPPHADEAARLMANWATSRPIPGITVEVINLAQASSPLIFTNIPASPGYEEIPTIVFYCHGDKQPPLHGKWSEGLDPYIPVLRGDRLYGRGSADDGYGIFDSILAVEILIKHGIPHGRVVVMTEFSEESGSTDLPFYLNALKPQLGEPGLFFCLDSGVGDFDRLWNTSSLRGVMQALLRVEVLEHEMHSGSIGGIVPQPYDIANYILNEVRDALTGRVLLPGLQPREIPRERVDQAKEMVDTLGDRVLGGIPFVNGARALGTPTEAMLNGRWNPCITVIGQRGLEDIEKAGNVIIPAWEIKLSIRIPPTRKASTAMETLQNFVESIECPAKVTFTPILCADGWHANPLPDWLEVSLNSASTEAFGKPMMYISEGGTIPFMEMIHRIYEDCPVVVTGVLDDESNAHGPNESLNIPAACKIMAVAANVISDMIDIRR